MQHRNESVKLRLALPCYVKYLFELFFSYKVMWVDVLSVLVKKVSDGSKEKT